MYGWCFLILYRCIVHVMPRPQIANGWAQNDSTTKGWREYLMTQLLDHCGQPKPTNFARKISGLCAVKFHKSVAGVMFLSRHITCVILYLRTSIVCNGFTPLWWFHILGQRCDWALGWSRPCCSTASTRFQLRTQLVMAPRVMGGGDDGRPLSYWYFFVLDFWLLTSGRWMKIVNQFHDTKDFGLAFSAMQPRDKRHTQHQSEENFLST